MLIKRDYFIHVFNRYLGLFTINWAGWRNSSEEPDKQRGNHNAGRNMLGEALGSMRSTHKKYPALGLQKDFLEEMTY